MPGVIQFGFPGINEVHKCFFVHSTYGEWVGRFEFPILDWYICFIIGKNIPNIFPRLTKLLAFIQELKDNFGWNQIFNKKLPQCRYCDRCQNRSGEHHPIQYPCCCIEHYNIEVPFHEIVGYNTGKIDGDIGKNNICWLLVLFVQKAVQHTRDQC